MKLQILDKNLYKDAPMRVAYNGDAGLDLLIRDTSYLEGRASKIRLGVAVEVPPGYAGWVVTRSSTLERHGVMVIPSIVDAGYRGEIHVLVTSWFPKTLGRGESICQLVVTPILSPTRIQVVKELLMDTDRGELGFGSSS